MNRFRVVLNKELKDSMRDRRAWMVAMLPAIFGPVLMMFLLSSAAKNRSDAKELTLPAIGRENAPDLVAYLEQHDILVTEFEGDAKTEIQAKNVDVILSIPEGYGEAFEAFQPAEVLLFGDESMLGRVVRLVAEVVDPVVVAATPGQPLPPLPEEVRIVHDRR